MKGSIMANVLQLNQSQIFAGTGTLTYTVLTAGTYSVGAQITVPQAVATGDGAGSGTGLGSGAGGGDPAGFSRGGISGTTGATGQGFGPVANLYPQPPLYGSNQTSGAVVSTNLTVTVDQNGTPIYTAPTVAAGQSALQFKTAFQAAVSDVITVVIGGSVGMLSVTSSNGTRLAVASTGPDSATVTFAAALNNDTITVQGQTFTGVPASNAYVIDTAANTSSALNGLYLDLYEGANGGTPVRIWYSTAGVGTAPPVPTGGRLVNVNLANNDSATVVATKTAAAFSQAPGATIYINAAGTPAFAYSNITAGPTTAPNLQTSTFTIATTRLGVALLPNQFNLITSNVEWAGTLSFVNQVNASSALSGVSGTASNSVATLILAVALNGITSNVFIQQGY